MAATGMHWNFAPCVAVPRDERWGRTCEGFGESPALVAELGAAAVRGLQGADLSYPSHVLATAKHYLGDGGTQGGIDQGDARIDETTLRAIRRAVPKARVDYSAGGEATPGAQAAVVVIGQLPYAEGQGDRKSLELDPADVAIVKRVKAAGLRTFEYGFGLR